MDTVTIGSPAVNGWPGLSMDGIQLSQGHRATTRRQFTFYHLIPITSWYSIFQLINIEKMKKAEELTLEPLSGFEHRTAELGIQDRRRNIFLKTKTCISNKKNTVK